MSSQVVEFGIAGYGHAAGCEPESVAGAARAALSRAVLDPNDLDLLVVAAGVPAAWLAGALNVRELQTLRLDGGEGGGEGGGAAAAATGLGIIAGQLVLQPELQTVLFTTANGTGQDPNDAAAVVLRRWHPRGRWLATEQFTAAGIGAGDEHDALVVEVVDRACRRAGVRRADLARLVHLHDPAAIAPVAALAGMPLTSTNAGLDATGPFAALEHYADRDALDPGDLVALTGVVDGSRWYCTLLEM